MIAYIGQGGLSLPDADYYIKDDARQGRDAEASGGVCDAGVYAGGPDAATGDEVPAQLCSMVETLLAANSMDRTKTVTNPKNRDHKMTGKRCAMAPEFTSIAILRSSGSAELHSDERQTNPDSSFRQVNGVVAALPLDSLKTYVNGMYARRAPWLSQPFVDANFKMRQALTGQKQIQDRWKRCVIWWMDRWEKRWASDMSRLRSARTASSAC